MNAQEGEQQPLRRISFPEIRALVSANNRAPAFTDECVIALCWKESNFHSCSESLGSTAKGLLQMTEFAIDTVNRITPVGVHFEHWDMLDPAKAIQCGTYFLQWCADQYDGDELKGLNKYGGTVGYHENVIAAEACLLAASSDPMSCLMAIQSHQLTRIKEGLMDDSSGRTRFAKKM